MSPIFPQAPCEETIKEILERYKVINKHAASYTWKRLGRPLDMELNLEDNNIVDETEEFERYSYTKIANNSTLPNAPHTYTHINETEITK